MRRGISPQFCSQQRIFDFQWSGVFLILGLSLLLLLPSAVKSQTQFYGLWEDPVTTNYFFVSVDVATANRTNIAPIGGLTGIIAPNTSTIDTWDNQYVFYGLYGSQFALTYVDIATGAVLNSVSTNENLFGFEYNCSNDTIYCLKEDNNVYSLVALDPVTGARYILDTLPNITAHVGGSFALNTQQGIYSFRGLANGNFGIFEVDIHTGTMLNSFVLNENIVGIEYDCTSDTVYGVWEHQATNTYNLMWVDPATAQSGVIDTLFGVSPGFISESDCFSPATGHYYFRGFSGPNLFLYTIDVNNGNIVSAAQMTDNVFNWEMDACCSVNCPLPTPDFGWSASNLSIAFSDSSQSATSWHWDFGDGDTAVGPTPTHTFAQIGTYLVCLTVGNHCGDTTICDSVTVDCPLPVAAWSYTQVGLTQIEVMDSSLHGTDRIWITGGPSDTLPQTILSFPGSGWYELCMVSINECGVDTLCDSVFLMGQARDQAIETAAFHLYPNPNSGNWWITWDAPTATPPTCHLYTPLGQSVRLSATRQGNRLHLKTDAPPGIYFLRIRKEEGLFTRKLILK